MSRSDDRKEIFEKKKIFPLKNMSLPPLTKNELLQLTVPQIKDLFRKAGLRPRGARRKGELISVYLSLLQSSQPPSPPAISPPFPPSPSLPEISLPSPPSPSVSPVSSRISFGSEDLEEVPPKKSGQKIGLILCHGTSHKLIPDVYALLADQWITVDIDPNANPDVVGDATSFETLAKLLSYYPDGYDVILEYHCPIRPREPQELANYLIAVRQLLSRNGIAIFPKMIVRIGYMRMIDGLFDNILQFKEKFLRGDRDIVNLVNRTLDKIGEENGLKWRIDGLNVIFWKS